MPLPLRPTEPGPRESPTRRRPRRVPLAEAVTATDRERAASGAEADVPGLDRERLRADRRARTRVDPSEGAAAGRVDHDGWPCLPFAGR